MISPVAIALALSFWAPYNQGQPVCPEGVVIHNVPAYGSPGSVPSASYVKRVDDVIEPNCNVFVDPTYQHMTKPMQCAFVARALGGSVFGLQFTQDRRNVMYAKDWVIPRACLGAGR